MKEIRTINFIIQRLRPPKKNFSFARVKNFFKKKVKTGVVMALFMDWATY
jgi:hypothetical protein